MVHTKLIISAVFGITGNVISVGLFASPVPTFYRIIKNKSVEEVKPEYYLLTTMNCVFWVLYAMPFIHPESFLVLTANGIGLIMNLVYVIIFLLYAKDDKQRMYVGRVLLIELVVISLVSGLAIGLAHTSALIPWVVGGFSSFFALLMLMDRLLLCLDVCKTKSAERMSFLLALSNTLNDLCWFIYAILRYEISLLVLYHCGFFMGMFQLVLYGVYYRCTPKTADVQLEGICIGNEKKPTTAKVQLQEIDTCDNMKLAPAELPGIVTAN